jgi:alpha,alpha-trehalase
MFVNVYQATPRDKPDFSWLERAYADISKDYEMWTHDPHLAGQTGLSRYYDFGDGPPPEAVQDESGFYRKVVDYFFFHPAEADDYVVETKTGITQGVAGKAHSLQVCDVALTMVRPECGPFGSATHHFAPVSLNSLLYKAEKDLEQISAWLGRPGDAEKWRRRAEERKKLITRFHKEFRRIDKARATFA